MVPNVNNTDNVGAALVLLATANTANTTGISFHAETNENKIFTVTAGTGTFQPITISNGNVEAIRIDAVGNVGIANNAPVDSLSVGGNAYFGNNLTVNQNMSAVGNVFGNIVLAAEFISITPTDYANLPAAAIAGAGARAFITDADGITFAANVAGGGANSMPVFSDGSVWKIG